MALGSSEPEQESENAKAIQPVSLNTSRKVLLVYPEFPDTYWSFRHALPLEGKQAAFPPLGLLTVSNMLPRSWERRLVDMNVGPLKSADVKWADLVFASAMLAQKESLRHVVELCKAEGKLVVVGGPYVSTSVEQLSAADHIFVGEVEATLPEFVRDLERGAARRIYKAVERPALSATPIPDFQLADLRRYSAMSVQYSRGCPFQCEFCDIIEIYGRVPRTKSNEQILAELEALLRAGWRGPVFIVDDNFIGNKRNVRQLLPQLAAWSEGKGYPFTFMTEASVNLAEDDELLRWMRRARFRRVFLGIETPVEETLKEAQKGQNTRRNLLDSVRKIQGFGMEVMAGFIVGFDSDPADIFERQIAFITASAIPLAMVNLLSALPDTQLWRRLEREGRLLEESTGNNSDCSLNFVPTMDPTLLVEGYKSIMRTIYSPRLFYQRARDCLTRVGDDDPRESRGGSVGSDVATLFRIVLTLGIRDSERREFWRYVYSVLLHHHKNFAQAIRLAAMGYHLRKLTRLYCGEENQESCPQRSELFRRNADAFDEIRKPRVSPQTIR